MYLHTTFCLLLKLCCANWCMQVRAIFWVCGVFVDKLATDMGTPRSDLLQVSEWNADWVERWQSAGDVNALVLDATKTQHCKDATKKLVCGFCISPSHNLFMLVKFLGLGIGWFCWKLTEQFRVEAILWSFSLQISWRYFPQTNCHFWINWFKTQD